MSGIHLQLMMSVWAVWGLAHGLRALGHWRARKGMILAVWQAGLIGQGRVVRGTALWVLGWSNIALVVATGLWLTRALPFEVGRAAVLGLCVPGMLITLTARRPMPADPEPPEVPRATASENK